MKKSPRKRNTTHGCIVADRGVYPELKAAARKTGWEVKSIRPDESDNISDEIIAANYGKGRYFLLTHDKEAFNHNVVGGFIGYIEYDEIPEKDQFMEFVINFTSLMSVFKSKNFKNCRIILQKEGYIKEKLNY